MTGKQLASAIRRLRGKLSIPMLTPNDVIYVYVEKADAAAAFDKYGDMEVAMEIKPEENGFGHYLGNVN